MHLEQQILWITGGPKIHLQPKCLKSEAWGKEKGGEESSSHQNTNLQVRNEKPWASKAVATTPPLCQVRIWLQPPWIPLQLPRASGLTSQGCPEAQVIPRLHALGEPALEWQQGQVASCLRMRRERFQLYQKELEKEKSMN